MTPVSLNPPPHSFPLTAEDQIQDHQNELFIFPNSSLDSTTSSLSCRSFFNVLDQTQTREIRELTHDQQEDGVALHSGSSSTEAGMDDRSQVCGHNSSAMYRREEDESKSKSKSGYDSAKWMSSKMRLMRKMMTPNSTPHTPKPSNTNTHDIPTFQTHDHENTHRINSTTRVCADCNTTTTPLWRGGPKGPKSLCNACGIRQRKARRASMAEGANGGSSYSRVNKKEKKPRANHFVQFKNKWKGTSSTSGGGMTSQGSERTKNIGLKDFAFGLSNSSASAIDHQVFPRDEVAEAALLLMDLSCAFLPI